MERETPLPRNALVTSTPALGWISSPQAVLIHISCGKSRSWVVNSLQEHLLAWGSLLLSLTFLMTTSCRGLSERARSPSTRPCPWSKAYLGESRKGRPPSTCCASSAVGLTSESTSSSSISNIRQGICKPPSWRLQSQGYLDIWAKCWKSSICAQLQ